MVGISRGGTDPGGAERRCARRRLHRRSLLLSVYAAGAPIKAIGGTRSDAKTQAILVRQDSPIRSAADLRGKRLAGTRGGWGQFLIDATLEKAQIKLDEATFAPLGPVDAKIALLAGSIDAWAVWEPYVSFATLKDKARVIADGEGLTPTVTFIVASDSAIASKRAAVQDFLQRLNKARLWSLDHIRDYAKNTAELTKLPEDVLLSAYTAQRTSPIVIDENVVKEVQEASDRATRYGILPKKLDVSQAVDRSFGGCRRVELRSPGDERSVPQGRAASPRGDRAGAPRLHGGDGLVLVVRATALKRMMRGR